MGNSPIPEPLFIPTSEPDPMCIGRLTPADDPEEEYKEFTQAELAANLEAEQAADRLVKVEASAATDDSDPTKCCSKFADDGKYAE